MQIDEQRLRHLVFITQQRRMRSLSMPAPDKEMIEADDPRMEQMWDANDDAQIAALRHMLVS